MTRDRVLIIVVALLLFVPFLGSVRLFDWDEINFAENAREMMQTGDYLHMQIDYRPFYEKPPLFIWLQVLSMKLFGVSAFSARLPNALIGVVTLLVLYSFGRRVYSRDVGLLWSMVYAGTLLPHFYFRSGIIDPLFNLFIFVSVWAMMEGSPGRGGLYAGLAVLTKGPVGLLLVGLTTLVAWVIRWRTTSFPLRNLVVMTCVAALLPALWFGIDYIQNGPTFIQENLAYQWRLLTTGEAGHEQPWYYHSIVVLFGCFPASLFFLAGIHEKNNGNEQQRVTRLWMLVLFSVVLVVFSVVTTKIIHYSSLTYLPLTYIAALTINDVIVKRRAMGIVLSSALVGMAALLTCLFAAVPLALTYKDALLALPTFRDVYLRAAITHAASLSPAYSLIALILLVGTVSAVVIQRKAVNPWVWPSMLFGSVALFVAVFLPSVGPAIESLTQGAAVDFYTSLRNKSVYVKPLTMKSYAHLFYTDKPYELSGAAQGISANSWEPWLLDSNINREAYFVAKVNDADPWRKHPQLRVIKSEGGFVFFQRVHLADSATP